MVFSTCVLLRLIKSSETHVILHLFIFKGQSYERDLFIFMGQSHERARVFLTTKFICPAILLMLKLHQSFDCVLYIYSITYYF
jgi:hypothetical protein